MTYVQNISQIMEKGHSELWGVNGELWDSSGRLRDFTDVGYHNGDVPIRDLLLGVNVIDFSATIPDDDQDDSQAFIDAIAAYPPNSTCAPSQVFHAVVTFSNALSCQPVQPRMFCLMW